VDSPFLSMLLHHILQTLHISPRLFIHDTPPTSLYTLSLHDALPICDEIRREVTLIELHSLGEFEVRADRVGLLDRDDAVLADLEIGEHTSELQSRFDLVCRLLLEKKKKHTRDVSL